MHAQVGFGTKKESLPIISVNGAQIYSADESFNKQISQKKIIFNKVAVSNANISDRNYLVITSKKNSNKNVNNLTVQIKKEEAKKKDNLLKKIKKEIARHEYVKEKFLLINFKKNPSSSHFYTAKSSNKVGLNYRTENKINAKSDNYTRCNYLVRALEYLHSQKIIFFNHKPIDFGFSKALSVRPPPILV
ncbi:hypothetical protein NZ698_13515 [Chryseobacterium sp. PBS4-4]|uniref:Protein kinase domain-containing protein n=1 Tax=Chryseobacterium edaphi TaxID=2976532 RepID=A0ABT2W7N1_9FLAO|nr:hypothetical protein [Chryseobacterium edaphi]MCU7618222.1 hypothetical protein [Chryseobacterium edaphi]